MADHLAGAAVIDRKKDAPTVASAVDEGEIGLLNPGWAAR
jgi:hypothetical protein